MNTLRLILFCTLALCSMRAADYDALWQEPALEQRIERDIRTYRMSNVVVRCLAPGGTPTPHARVQIEQTSHAFLFGANIFMLGGFPTAEENRRYEESYLRLFNFATIPFFWSDLEPESGKLRFTKDSPPLYRRPPPDVVVEFCRKHGIAMKGHPLVWHQWFPKWRPDDPQALIRRLDQRITEIAAHYGNAIPRWEVVNEAMERDMHADPWCNLPPGYVQHTFQTADRVFPGTSRLMLNEATTFSWLRFSEETSPYYRLIRTMLDQGARIDEIGMQLHIFNEKNWQALLAGEMFAPQHLLKVLDRYGDFGHPIAITELTLPTLPGTAAGESDQAKVARNFYRLWFSHPRVTAISWWNVVDDTAAPGEDRWKAGLIRRDFSPKPAFTALDQLINHEWRTRLNLQSDARGTASFRGFHGDYTITVQSEGRTLQRTFTLRPNTSNEWVVQF